MTDLIDTTEMYLRTVLELEEEGVPPMRARIVERLEHSGPTVSQTVGRMERDGLLHVRPDRTIELTDEGRTHAVRVMRKHRLAERLLADVIGLEIDQVHQEACRWEHVMSEAVEQRLLALLDGPTRSPYGMRIPGLSELEHHQEAGEHLGGPRAGRSLHELTREPVDSAERFRLAGVPEVVQADDELLGELSRTGLLSGGSFSIDAGQDLPVLVPEQGDPVTVPAHMVRAVRVERV